MHTRPTYATEYYSSDNICFNYEGELRVDTVTAIETYETQCEKHLVYHTAVHGPIKMTSVKQKLSPSLKEIHDNQSKKHPYTHLIFSHGASVNTFNISGVQENCFFFIEWWYNI